MERYLLFDSGCLACSGLAHEIEQAAGGWLSVRSLRSAEVQRHLDRAAPGWKWEPMLLELDGDTARVHRGIDMRLRIAAGVGPRRAWAIAVLVQQAGEALTEAQNGRRNFLKGSAGVMAGVVLGLTAWPAFGHETADDQPVPLGPTMVVGADKARELAAQALASRDMVNLLEKHAVSGKEAIVQEHANGSGRADWSAVFPAAAGGVITYLVRSGSQIRTQAVYERDGTLVALSVDGMLSRTVDQPLGQKPSADPLSTDDCTAFMCGLEPVTLCTRCCSTCNSYRSTANQCCVCKTASGGTFLMGCRPKVYGPCGIC